MQMKTFFENIFKNMPVPVIVCGASAQHPVVYMNTAAKITINPLLSISDMTGRAKGDYLADVLTFKDRDTLDIIFRALAGVGAVADFKADIAGADSGFIPVSVTASRVVTGEDAYYILYLYTGKGAAEVRIDVDRIVASVFDMSYNIADTNEAINAILGYIGNCIHVSRVYIFEDASDIYTKNTYEWCAKDIEPAIQDLQSLKKEDYNYDVIIKEGVYITDDIRSLPPEDRDILAMQGIKSLAIIALQHAGPAIGYVGFDDCAEYRVWSGEEISLLKKIASILVSLIERRKADEKAARSLDIMKTISNNIDSIVYVNAIKSYDLIFVNEALAQSLGKSNEALIGQPCWKVLQLGQTGPCSFCPMKKMLDADGNVVNESYRWEFKNTVTDKWFMVKDAIIKWIDGSDVHIETATEITSQKQYEEQLMQAASIDMMTGAYNREWGYKVIGEAVAAMQHDD
ncbi:MAG: PAS domain-containing protein, partial [Oscillospiraceae bacterium]|nr:PAS domain-containing protein [Oscillospiraceae bacterium]